MRLILITGTPGTGKTFLSGLICERYGFKTLDFQKVVSAGGAVVGFDREMNCDIIDLVLARKAVLEEIRREEHGQTEGLVIDSHLSHSLGLMRVDACIVVKCPLPILKKRLEMRGYSAEKIRENLDAEIFDVCLTEARDAGYDPIIVDGSGTLSFSLLDKMFS